MAKRNALTELMAMCAGLSPRALRRGAAVLTVVTALGCGDGAVAPHVASGDDAAALYWRLELDYRAITLSTLSPYDTLRLTAIPRDGHGAPLSGLGPVTFRSTDQRVQVTPDGLLQAHEPGELILVIAELAAGNARHADTALVSVTADTVPPSFASLSIDPEPSDSARWAVGGVGGWIFGGIWKWVHVQALDMAGNPIPGLTVVGSVSDSSMASWIPAGSLGAFLNAKSPGQVTIYATATAYGVTRSDTLPFTITMPVIGNVTFRRDAAQAGGAAVAVLDPSEVTISPGGTVRWYNGTGTPVDVTFDAPTDVAERGALTTCGDGDPGGAGDVPAFGDTTRDVTSAANCRSRRFPVPGVYPYHSTLTGVAGRVVVTDGLSDS
jgi:plastocyanin